MIKRLLLVIALGVTVSGCFVAPLALIGPATSGFTTASIIQSGATTGVNYMVKKSTGKTITEHAIPRGAKHRQGGVAKLLWPQRSVDIYISTRQR